MYYVYILRSRLDGKRYIGSTSNPEKRIIKHNSGSVKSTKNRKPFDLIHLETYDSKQEALQRELFYKTGKGREYLDVIGK